MNVLTTILGVIIALIGFTLVICLHELGHLYFAKRYGVYCYEYSVGIGPKIVSKRLKGHETKISLRWIPLGGYVAMAGDEDEEESTSNIQFTESDEPIVPLNRTLTGVSHPKQAMIMSAGVLVNFVLALFLFFIRNTFTPVANPLRMDFVISDNSNAANAGFNNGDIFYKLKETKVHFEDNRFGDINEKIIQSDLTLNSFLDLNLPSIYENIQLNPTSPNDYITRTFLVYENGDKTKEVEKTVTSKAVATSEGENPTYGFELFGFGARYTRYTFAQAFTQSFIDFGESIKQVFIAIGSLFTPQGFNNVGGIVSVFVVNDMAVKSGFSTVLYLWGLLSANVGVMNLIPFPGLDGWQLVVCGIEGVTRKKLSTKFKSMANTIGMLILFGLGAVLIVVDLFRYF